MIDVELRPYQRNAVELARSGIKAGHRKQVLSAPTGSGKCLGKGTPVMLSSGAIVAVEDIRVGDRLMGNDGTPRCVLSVARGREMLYRVTPKKGDSYVVNASHLLSLRLTHGSDGIRLADGSHIERGKDVVAVRADVFARSNATARHCLKGWRAQAIESFEREDGAEDRLIPPYLLGAWLGDGRIGRASISKPRCKMVDEWISYGERMGYAASVDACGDRCPTWLLTEGRNGHSFNLIQSNLKSIGVLHRKHIPDAYKYASIKDRLELLAGLIDSDGHESNSGCDWISASKELADDFAFVCRSVGLACYTSHQKKGISETGFEGWYWRASVSGDLSIIPTRDKPFAPRKQIKRHLVHGITVEPIGEGDYYGFQIDGNRLFLLGDFTVTHNTEIACSMLQDAYRKTSRAMFLVDRVVLVDQTSERLDRYGIPHGVHQANHWRCRPWERIQVCSAQTIERRGIPEDIDVIFVDEAHCMRKIISQHLATTNAIVIGLTATPFTKGMGSIYSNIVNVTTMNQLIADGFLVPLKMYAAKAIDTTGMKVVAGEWSEKEIEERGLDIIGDIVAEWTDKTDKHFGGPVKTIVFSATVDHGEELCRQFNAAGYRFEQISYRDGGDDHRRALIEEFRKPDSTIHGLVSCEVFTKGFDVPDVLCGISARPYRKSLSSHMQQMGRVMRSSPGKEFGLWLDHSGNVMRFMADTAEIFEAGCSDLDDGKREEKARKEPTEREKNDIKCSCGYVMMAWEKACPGCGKERVRLTSIGTLPGQMVELDGKAANRKYSWEQKEAFIAGLRSHAINRGYQGGWVAHQYQKKFGVWPNDPRLKSVPAGPITAEVSNWIRAQNIAYAKRRAA